MAEEELEEVTQTYGRLMYAQQLYEGKDGKLEKDSKIN